MVSPIELIFFKEVAYREMIIIHTVVITFRVGRCSHRRNFVSGFCVCSPSIQIYFSAVNGGENGDNFSLSFVTDPQKFKSCKFKFNFL